MRSTTYQCDQCRDVLVQGLALEARYFGPDSGVGVWHDVAIPVGGLHFCGHGCLETFLRRMEAHPTTRRLVVSYPKPKPKRKK